MKRLVLCTAFGCLMSVASARDFGQWEATDPVIREWYQALMQPDNPAVSCCGEADAYWADLFEVDGDKYVAIITDSRPDGPLRRKHIDVGTKIVVPNHKLKYDQSNPTGHGDHLPEPGRLRVLLRRARRRLIFVQASVNV